MGWTKLGNLFIIVKIQSFVNPVDSVKLIYSKSCLILKLNLPVC